MPAPAAPRLPLDRAGFRLLLTGLGGLLLGGFIGHARRGEAQPRPALHEAADPSKRPAASEESSGTAPLRTASSPEEESGGRAAAGTVDFVAAARGAMSEVDEWDRLRRLHAVIDRLGPADIEAAVAQMRRLSRSERELVARGLGERWAHFDPAAALAYAKRLGSTDTARAIAEGAFRRWAAEAPDAMRAWLAARPAGEERNSAVARAVGQLGHTDLPAALHLLNQLPEGPKRSDAITELFRNPAVTGDPQLSGKLYALLPPNVRGGYAVHLAFRMAQNDVNTALAWVAALPEGAVHRQALAGIGKAWAQDDPVAALNWILLNTPPTENKLTPWNKSTLEEPFSSWAEVAPDEALAWALALPLGKNREDLAANGIEHLARTDPQRAAELIKTKFPADSRLRATVSLAVTWTNNDPVGAAAWAAQLPEGDTRSEALSRVAAHWAMREPAAAARWVDTLPAGPARDKAIGKFAEQVVDADPEGALTWVSTIGDYNYRNMGIRNLAGRWNGYDPAAARKWIMGTDQLTPEEKARLLKKE